MTDWKGNREGLETVMQFGICVMADVDEIGFFNHAEGLGYDSVWVTDRHAGSAWGRARPALGRVHLGIGTGNTAMRTMGQRPMRIAEYDEYLRVLAALLRGETVDYRYHDRVRPIRMLTNNAKYLGLEPKIPLYFSGFGPRAMELAGKHGDGLVFAIPPRGVAVAEALGHAREGAARAGRALDGFRSCALTNVALLEPGEPVDSPRVVRTVGPNVMAPGVPASDLEALLRARGGDARRATTPICTQGKPS